MQIKIELKTFLRNYILFTFVNTITVIFVVMIVFNVGEISNTLIKVLAFNETRDMTKFKRNFRYNIIDGAYHFSFHQKFWQTFCK